MASVRPLLNVAEGEPPTRRSFRALLLLSFSFFLTFSAFNAAQALNGSIAAPPGLASAQFMVIYIVFAFFSIPAPKLLSFVGPKACVVRASYPIGSSFPAARSMNALSSQVIGMLPYATLTASFLTPATCKLENEDGCWQAGSIWAVRMLAALLVGLGAPILWTGQGVYLAGLAAEEVTSKI